jgi:photosystem II stability/assembly factor-like uncharacterized protein
MKPSLYYSILKFFCIMVLEITIPLQFLLAQWISQNGYTPEKLVDVVMLDSLKAIAIGERNGILRTVDAGSSWDNQTIALSAIYHWNKISFIDTLSGAIIADHRLMTSSDGGLHWQVRTLPTSTQLCLSVKQTGHSGITIGTDSGWVYNTSDTGKTWNSEKISVWPILKFFVWRGPPFVGVLKYALTPYSLCTQYVIPPPSWSEKTLPFNRGLGSEAFDAEFCNGGGSGFIVGVFGDLWSQPAIIRKLMNDTAWNSLSIDMGTGPLLGVSAPSADVIYTCGTGGRIYKTTNGGDDWTKLTVPTTRNLHAIFFYDENHGFAVGDSGTILYTSNGGEIPVDVKENKILPREFALKQNYPNPFNPNTVIGYQLPVNSYVILKVYDMLGKEVAMLVNGNMSAGKHTAVWNASRCASGVYFYHLDACTAERRKAGLFHETKKLVVLR